MVAGGAREGSALPGNARAGGGGLSAWGTRASCSRRPAAQSLCPHIPGDKFKCQQNKHRIPISGAASHQVEKPGESWKALAHVLIPTGQAGSSGHCSQEDTVVDAVVKAWGQS